METWMKLWHSYANRLIDMTMKELTVVVGPYRFRSLMVDNRLHTKIQKFSRPSMDMYINRLILHLDYLKSLFFFLSLSFVILCLTFSSTFYFASLPSRPIDRPMMWYGFFSRYISFRFISALSSKAIIRCIHVISIDWFTFQEVINMTRPIQAKAVGFLFSLNEGAI